MKRLFDEIVTNGECVLERLIREAQPETVQLDFKEKTKAAHGDWEKEDRRSFSKALSAFANSMGGLIIYGIVAKRDDSGVDAASKLAPIQSLSAFASQAHTLAGQLIMPRHEGVIIHAVPSCTENDRGYLAIWVERSDRRPHRSEGGEKYYYKRSGSNSVAMEHFEIEDAFNRLAPAELEVGWCAKAGGTIGAQGQLQHQINIILELTNHSRVTATLPFLRLASTAGAPIDPYGLDGNGAHGLPRKRWDPNLFAGGADDAVHPGQTLPVTALRLEVVKYDDFWMINGTQEATIKVECEYGCANARKREQSIWITSKKLRSALGVPEL